MSDWSRLERVYRDRGIALGLGAGVSKNSGIPTWLNLLRKVAEQPASIGTDAFDELAREGFTPPALASILAHRYEDRPTFAEAVRKAIYEQFPFFPGGYSREQAAEMVAVVHDRNPTLRAIGALCAVKRSGAPGFTPNPRLKAIINFNIDALLQAYVVARFRTRLVRTIERPSASASRKRIPVYHVHGFLRFDRRIGDRTSEAPDAMVLTEGDYYDVFGNPLSVFTYTFMHLLREHAFLFIGLSMADQNLRRLLYYSRLERAGSYRAEGETGRRAAERATRHFALLQRPAAPALEPSIEASLEPLGTRVIWIDNYNEIPDRLGAMYTGAGNAWHDVY